MVISYQVIGLLHLVNAVVHPYEPTGSSELYYCIVIVDFRGNMRNYFYSLYSLPPHL